MDLNFQIHCADRNRGKRRLKKIKSHMCVIKTQLSNIGVEKTVLITQLLTMAYERHLHLSKGRNYLITYSGKWLVKSLKETTF